MAETRVGVERVHDEPGMPCCARKLKNAQRMMETYRKNTEAPKG